MLVILLAGIIFYVISLSNDYHGTRFSDPVQLVNEYIYIKNRDLGIRSEHYETQNKFVLYKIFRNGVSRSDSITKSKNIFPDEIDPRDIIEAMMHFGIESDDNISIDTDIFSLCVHTVNKDKIHSINNSGSIPLLSDLKTVTSFARMCYNVYDSKNNSGDWYNTDPFIIEDDYGWQDDGLRCYLYTNCDRSILILSIKGTSTSLFSNNSTTTIRDKYMDNIMFSCCCGVVDFTWTPVCSCYNSSNKCFYDCVSNVVIQQQDSYFRVAQKIFRDIRVSYPQATIWITGHSLGGALASLLTVAEYDHKPDKVLFMPPIFAVSFESPGEMLYAQRLGIFPFPWSIDNLTLFDSLLSKYPVYHIYHTADPIPYGACVGKFSSCYYGGYALETKCHIGHIYEIDLGSERFDINKHKIKYIVENVLSDMYMMPTPKPQPSCVDCSYWKFVTRESCKA